MSLSLNLFPNFQHIYFVDAKIILKLDRRNSLTNIKNKKEVYMLRL